LTLRSVGARLRTGERVQKGLREKVDEILYGK